jgi:septal ring factor EnvC (AmiA/AmiB activator)
MQRMIVSGILVLSLISFVWYKFNSLENKLDEANKMIKELNDTITQKNNKITNSNLVIKIKDREISDLRKSIEESNAIIAQKNQDLLLARENIEIWKKESSKNKLKYLNILKKDIDYSKAKCVDGLNLNQGISNLNYEDL